MRAQGLRTLRTSLARWHNPRVFALTHHLGYNGSVILQISGRQAVVAAGCDRRIGAEADVSTKEAQAHAHARFSRAHGYQERKARDQGAATEGPKAAGGDQGVGQEAELEGKLSTATPPGVAA
jgi:hypothetical protein